MGEISPGRPLAHAKTNVEAARWTIRALEAKDGRHPEDEALVTYILTTAAAVDGPKCGALLRKEYREALGELLARHERSGDGAAELLADMRASVGDAAQTGTILPGPGSGRGEPAAGVSVHAVAANGRRRRARATA